MARTDVRASEIREVVMPLTAW